MKLSFENYLQKRPSRRSFLNSEEGKILLAFMEERLQKPQNGLAMKSEGLYAMDMSSGSLVRLNKIILKS